MLAPILSFQHVLDYKMKDYGKMQLPETANLKLTEFSSVPTLIVHPQDDELSNIEDVKVCECSRFST